VGDCMMERRPVIRVTDILGAGMDCLDAASIGQIAELVVGAGSRRILYVVVKPHERLRGANGDVFFAVPWGALSPVRLHDGELHYRLPISLTRLRRAPTFQPDRWPDFGNSREMAEVHSFFGEPPGS
jgi:hypothetical protein